MALKKRDRTERKANILAGITTALIALVVIFLVVVLPAFKPDSTEKVAGTALSITLLVLILWSLWSHRVYGNHDRWK